MIRVAFTFRVLVFTTLATLPLAAQEPKTPAPADAKSLRQAA